MREETPKEAEVEWKNKDEMEERRKQRRQRRIVVIVLQTVFQVPRIKGRDVGGGGEGLDDRGAEQSVESRVSRENGEILRVARY